MLSLNTRRVRITAMALAAAATGVAVNAATADTPTRETQTYVLHYLSGQLVIGPLGTGNPYVCPLDGPSDGQYQNATCVDVSPPSWAQYMTITSQDNNSPLPVPMFLQETASGSPIASGQSLFVCGATTDQPVPADHSGWALSVVAASAYTDPRTNDPLCVGAATEGTVTVTYSNLP